MSLSITSPTPQENFGEFSLKFLCKQFSLTICTLFLNTLGRVALYVTNWFYYIMRPQNTASLIGNDSLWPA